MPRPKRPPLPAGLPADIVAAIRRVYRLGDRNLREAAEPLLTPAQVGRLAALNRKAQAGGLTPAERRERSKLSRLYEKSMVVRAVALAELHRRGVPLGPFLKPRRST